MSTTTLLEAINRVLLDVGERQVTSISNPASRKAKEYLADAYEDMQMFHNWEWLHAFRAVNSFTNEQTTIDNCRRIRAAYWFTGDRYIHIDWTPFTHFKRVELSSFNTTDNPATRPRLFTFLDESRLLFNPYPTDDAGRDKIRVEIISYSPPPQNPTDTFECPERFMNALYKRAVYMMTARHLGDLNAAQLIEGEFQQVLQRFRDQENKTTMKGTNMYRGDYGV